MDDSEDSEEIKEISEEYSKYIINPDEFTKIKSIGKGGYAEVWLVSYRGTDKQAALKQLFTTVTANQVHHFAREIQTMASAVSNHPFFLKFLGFSPKRPFCLLSEYMANGSLYKLIRQDPKGEILNGTRKTLIAMGIASAMSCLHKLSIIHRDLKSMNILLDSEYLPRLCDFGIARFNSTDEKLTMRLGTPHWMAPESLYGKGYSFPVDVYSFAMVLYELLTFKLPWAGMDPIAVTRAVVIEKKRPKLPKCPPALQSLITRCWDNNPDERPTFAEIYRLFATGKVAFSNTNQAEVQKLNQRLIDLGFEQPISGGKRIKPSKSETPTKTKQEKHSPLKKARSMTKDSLEDDENDVLPDLKKFSDSSDALERKNVPILLSESDSTLPHSIQNEKNKSTPSKSKDSPLIIRQEEDSDILLQQFKHKRQASATGLKIDHQQGIESDLCKLDTAILSDLKNPKFRSYFSRIVKHIAAGNVREFFRCISQHFSDKTSSDDFAFILKTLRPVFEYPYAIDAFQRKGLHYKLPLKREELFQTCLDFLYALFSRNPAMFQDDFVDQMEHIIKLDPDSALCLLQFCAKKYTQFVNPWSLLDTLYNDSEMFLSCASIAEYLSTIFYLCQSFKDFTDARLEPSLEIFMESLQLSDARAVSVAYNALCYYHPKIGDFDISLISQHIQDEALAPHVLPLLLRNDVPPSQELIDALLVSSTTNQTSNLVLVKLCDKKEAASLLAQNPWWAAEKLPTSLDTLRIFIAVMTHPENRASLAASKESYELIKDLCNETDPRIISFISSVVRRFPQKRSTVKRMSITGALKAIINTTKSMDDEGATHAMLLIIQFLAVVRETEEFALLPDLLRKQLKNNGKSACLSLTLIALLSGYKCCADQFKDPKLQKYFKKLLKDEDYKEYAEAFIRNISSYEE